MKVNGESVRADVKVAEEFLETIDKLIVKKNYLLEQIFNMDKAPYSGNIQLKRLSFIRRLSQYHISYLLR